MMGTKLTEGEFEAKVKEIEEISKKQPEDNEIFKYMYEARKELVTLQAGLMMTAQADPTKEVQHQLARILVMMGENEVATDEVSNGCGTLQSAQRYLESIWQQNLYQPSGSPVTENSLDATKEAIKCASPYWKCAGTLMDTYNNLGIIWCNRNEGEKAVVLLEAAEHIYERWMKEGKDDEQLTKRLENLYTSTAFYLAQVYGQRKETKRASLYVHKTLQIQLLSKKEFDKMEWTSNALRLSGFYLAADDFAQSSHCLHAARKVLPLNEDDQLEANIKLAWAKYYLGVMQFCRKRHEEYPNDKSKEFDLRPRTHLAGGNTNETQQFTGLDIPAPITTIKLIHSMEDARDIYFKPALEGFTKALEFYVLDGYVTDHISTKEDISALYKELTHWEPDVERQVAMHKRRVQLFENVLGGVNVSYYMSDLRQILFHNGEVCNQIVEIRTEQKAKGGNVTAKKINQPCGDGIKFFDMFLNTFRADQSSNQTCDIPTASSVNNGMVEVEKEHHQVFLLANMHIAKLLTKVYEKEIDKACAWVNRAVQRYEYINDWAANFDVTKTQPELSAELAVCKEMATLLPQKIKTIKDTGSI
eukprot:TRINITY_DN61862_c0_g1_i1.p2 TRINITY_DN61862_c0_g1~~TRINITY_DN61862_c0_g1_i1.p2  ORF type:complete len:596 (-),score=73.72 TRINITY_DN61862_c0_g1_i1:2558-4321(-)